eukprot:TRINITY_DN1305_c0_g3_i1.p1 TRINITY_DN1305_c0_g3~~TRINITY_DN1305_c0_g3_i1.p1  ORF type:complete len:1027 (-),score=228.28 TRINITY_DN1305_c0_g3_i1:493-3573(-)
MESAASSTLPVTEMPVLELPNGHALDVKVPEANENVKVAESEENVENTAPEPASSPPPAFVAADSSDEDEVETEEGKAEEEGDEIQLNLTDGTEGDQDGSATATERGEESGDSVRCLTKSERRFQQWWTTMQQRCPGVSNLHSEIVAFAQELRPTLSEMQQRKMYIDAITNVVQHIWRNAVVHVFGSCATGLCLPGSDIDLTIEAFLEKGLQQPSVQTWQKNLKNALWKSGLVMSVQPIPKAKVPILKLVMKGSGLSVDIAFQSLNGPKAVPHVLQQLREQAALEPLCLLLKVYLGQRNLNEAYKGGIGSYCLLNLIGAHLKGLPLADRSYDLGKILWGFFVRYGCLHDYKTEVVTVNRDREKVPRTRQQRGWGAGLLQLSVEDPQAPENDIGKISFRIEEARQHFARSAQHLEDHWQQREVLWSILDPSRQRWNVGAFNVGEFDDGEEYVVQDGLDEPKRTPQKKASAQRAPLVKGNPQVGTENGKGKKRKQAAKWKEKVQGGALQGANGGARSRVIIDLDKNGEPHEKAVEVVTLSDDEAEDDVAAGLDDDEEEAEEALRRKKAKSKKVKVPKFLKKAANMLFGQGKHGGTQGVKEAVVVQKQLPLPALSSTPPASADMNASFTWDEQPRPLPVLFVQQPQSHRFQQQYQQPQQQYQQQSQGYFGPRTSFLRHQGAHHASPPFPAQRFAPSHVPYVPTAYHESAWLQQQQHAYHPSSSLPPMMTGMEQPMGGRGGADGGNIPIGEPLPPRPPPSPPRVSLHRLPPLPPPLPPSPPSSFHNFDSGSPGPPAPLGYELSPPPAFFGSAGSPEGRWAHIRRRTHPPAQASLPPPRPHSGVPNPAPSFPRSRTQGATWSRLPPTTQRRSPRALPANHSARNTNAGPSGTVKKAKAKRGGKAQANARAGVGRSGGTGGSSGRSSGGQQKRQEREEKLARRTGWTTEAPSTRKGRQQKGRLQSPIQHDRSQARKKQHVKGKQTRPQGLGRQGPGGLSSSTSRSLPASYKGKCSVLVGVAVVLDAARERWQ